MTLLETIKWDWVRKNLVVPVVARMGTAVSVWLIAKGFPADAAHALLTGVSAAVLFGWDLVVGFYNRRSSVK